MGEIVRFVLVDGNRKVEVIRKTQCAELPSLVSVGSTADSVLLLVRAGKTEEASAKQTIEALNRANLDISGVILNGVEEV